MFFRKIKDKFILEIKNEVMPDNKNSVLQFSEV
jgi:hypothetical protein